MSENLLEIGWVLNDEFHPKYWRKRDARAGCHAPEDLFRVSPCKLKHHSLVFAQSGSGKSFLVGRLVEEICLRTRARCVLLDPNSDYSRVAMINTEVWESAGYNDDSGMGSLPTEDSSEAFEQLWRQVAKTIFADNREDLFDEGPVLRLNLADLDPSMFVRQPSENLHLEIEHCLDFAERLLALHSTFNPKAELDATRMTSFIEEHLSLAKRLSADELERYVFNEFGDSVKALEQKLSSLTSRSRAASDEKEAIKIERERRGVQFNVQSARRRITDTAKFLVKVASFISDDTVRLFIGRLHWLKEKQMLYGSKYEATSFTQLSVIDLPTFEDDKRGLVVGAALSQIWKRARLEWEDAVSTPDQADQRVPIFIIVDEAHNLIPADTTSATLESIREQFRRVAAEGRKFGIFLVLITQRPDKLDPLIVSECENKMILRVGSKDVLKKQESVLGLTEKQLAELEDATRFKPGRAFCIGPWANLEKGATGIQKFYGAARRTAQGGKDLNDDYWTSSEFKSTLEANAELEYDPFAD